MNRKLFVVSVVCAALSLGACGSDGAGAGDADGAVVSGAAVGAGASGSVGAGGADADFTNIAWQVTNVYTTPENPSAVPDEIAGSVFLTLGDHTLTGYTGCSPLQGVVAYANDAQESASPELPTALTVTTLELDETAVAGCTGKAEYIHQAITNLLTSGSLIIEHNPPHELVLREQNPSGIDVQSLKLVRP
ncbi:hypothetical protein [Corynebacterium sp. HS2168-gen11]|uniref:hypothetical protein n=1 Tax=Corynebacterium sp. HS2168-gen11 TaxID=2974027 RepID=UPI00216B0EE9|nr:hypothetical protein [Corynebacterium sp. HS2168-gen11]MCS4536082.1 hypothetical protein [Corynebacterium sp. HS2168-gen11]